MNLLRMFCLGLTAFGCIFVSVGQEYAGSVGGKQKPDNMSGSDLQFYGSTDMKIFDNRYGLSKPNLNRYKSGNEFGFAETGIVGMRYDKSFLFDRNPYSFDYHSENILSDWSNGYIEASGGRSTLPGLFSRQSAEFALVQNVGKFTFTAMLTADKYQLFRGVQNNFGIGGSIAYRVQDNLSLNVFGTYYKNSLYFSHAAMPYIDQSAYGTFADMQFGEHFGMNAGVKRQFDPYDRRWLTVPIVTPYIKLNNGTKFGVDVGWFVGWLIDRAVNGGNYYNSDNYNPTIAPPVPTMPPVR